MKEITSHTWLRQELELVTAKMVYMFFTGLNKLMFEALIGSQDKKILCK